MRISNRVLVPNRLVYMDPDKIDQSPWSYYHDKYGVPEDHLNDFRTDMDLLSDNSAEYDMKFRRRHREILKMLPEKMQKILNLYFRKKLYQSALAQKLGLTQGAISHQLSQAKILAEDFGMLPDLFFEPEKLKVELMKAGLTEEETNFFIQFTRLHSVSKASKALNRTQGWGSKRLAYFDLLFTGDLKKILKISKKNFGGRYYYKKRGCSNQPPTVTLHTVEHTLPASDAQPVFST